MEHVVFYTGRDRTPQFRRMPSIDEAVRFVESLRNGEGIDDSQVYSLSEVPLRFQTYYRVEVPAEGGAGATDQAPSAFTAPVASAGGSLGASAVEPTPLEPTSFAATEPTASLESVPMFEPAPAEAATPPSAAVAVETLPPAPAVEVLEPATAEASIPDLLNGPVGGPAGGNDADAEAAANGKPHRGLGFFAR